jgi:MFS superfamily sulfate permease-like transporter
MKFDNHFFSIGILVLLALGFLMPSLAYIPKAILAAVIITSVIFMVELEELKPMWKSRSKFTSCIAFKIRQMLIKLIIPW